MVLVKRYQFTISHHEFICRIVFGTLPLRIASHSHGNRFLSRESCRAWYLECETPSTEHGTRNTVSLCVIFRATRINTVLS